MNTKDLRVIGVPWHTAHQFELSKMFKSYDHLMNHYREWGEVSRPVPDNMKIVIEFDRSQYDLAILHVDQQCIDPSNNKGKLFREFEELTRGLPRVVINHMTPFDDKLEFDECVKGMKELVGDIPMVVNSKTAAAQWGWGHPIIHGINPEEWFDLPKEPRVVTSLSTGGMNKAYGREMLHVTIDLLRERGHDLQWIQATVRPKSWEAYRDYIGRSLVYFHPAYQSPMPRSRTEAMMSGACIVSTRYQDWGDYIVDENGKSYSELYPEENGVFPVFQGVNGFIVPNNPHSAADLIAELLTTRIKEAREIGQRGKEFAKKTFHSDRWMKDWADFLEGVMK